VNLNEKLAHIITIAEDDRRQTSISRADKNKPKLIDKLLKQARSGCTDGLTLNDNDPVYVKYLGDFFKKEGFEVQEVEQNCYTVSVSRR
jgi:hypothetical protein